MQTETNPQLWPLLAGNTNNPALVQGAQTSFQFQDVPDRSPTGPLAYYLQGALVTFTGQVVQATGSASIFSDQFFGALFTSIAWIQTWFGAPVQAQHVLGTQWAVTEFFVNGQRYGSEPRSVIAASGNGTYAFEVTIFVPAGCNRTFNLEEETAQLALLFRASQLQINVAPASVIASQSANATITNLKARASAILVPRQELVLGTPIETILTQVVAGGSNAVRIQNFGVDTGIQGCDPGGGVLALLFLTTLNNQGGSFASQNITDFTWQWRGQNYTQDILALLSTWKRQLPYRPYLNLVGNMAGGGLGASQLEGIPYAVNNANTFGATGTPANVELNLLLFWALILNGSRPRLTALQTADSDQTFNMTVTGGYAGNHQILGFYARSWQAQMRANWLAQVFAGGNGSLAAYVMGATANGAKLVQRAGHGKAFTTNDQARYLPWQLVPGQVASAVGA